MAEIRREGDTILVGDRVIIERGPARKSAKATPELLADDVTATHYQAPRPATEDEIADPAIPTTEDGQRISIDAAGKPIELGKPMVFLDYLGDQGFYIAELADRADYDPEHHTEKQCWQPREFIPDGGDRSAAETAAINAALKIAG